MVNFTIRIIKGNYHRLTLQQYRTLMGQAKAGQCSAALKGLHKIIDPQIKNSGGTAR